MMAKKNSDTVGKDYEACKTKNMSELEGMLADGVGFTSPLDDHIDKAGYMKSCWPNSEQAENYHFEALVAAEGNKVVSRYTVDWKADRTFKLPCTECLELEGKKIKRIDCYFGFVPRGTPVSP